MTTTDDTIADAFAHQLEEPDVVAEAVTAAAWWRQSLAHGAPGIALLHVARAANGQADWDVAHRWLSYISAAPLTLGQQGSHPFYGATALAHVLAMAAPHHREGLRRPLDVLETGIRADLRVRLDAANRRISQGRMATLEEFDAIHGLTGYGAYLLRRDPDGADTAAVLDYLVRLTEPLTVDGEHLPGWWVPTGTNGRYALTMPGGHANSGVAHGIAGPLALLSLAARRGVTRPGTSDAIETILAWLDRWRPGPSAPWPYLVTRRELREGIDNPPVLRPSWCYGEAGLARACQLAALALGDPGRGDDAERTARHAFTCAEQLAAVREPSLCHGFAGLAHCARRIAADARPQSAESLRHIATRLIEHAGPTASDDPAAYARATIRTPGAGAGLLDGLAGIALSRLDAPDWDTCLLLT
ncbi:lanthionine synthetase C family protein [Actinacidiphila paucisporea]|uniref:Lanthionine synthetase C-like protein n=1 Tax=Actinacidiphila paucisporea TaxID=310782 RepID=A0A1M6YJM6_9ACTN|nr:lanthionine synthetase C family protein [Actinacidiphila paucisporea]SHL18456.1 Lanthionine synthetase C-like protein [Actinacidiphila paucisporea]